MNALIDMQEVVMEAIREAGFTVEKEIQDQVNPRSGENWMWFITTPECGEFGGVYLYFEDHIAKIALDEFDLNSPDSLSKIIGRIQDSIATYLS